MQSVDSVVLLLIGGMSADEAGSHLVRDGMSPEDAAGLVSSARQRITLAADYVRTEQIGQSVRRLNDLYAKSMSSDDIKTALQAQRELNKLLGLYVKPPPSAEDMHPQQAGESARILDLVAGHLVPLGLAASDDPIEEHARLAAEAIRNGWRDAK
jgi:hypothetical protein